MMQKFENPLFIDIETASMVESYDDLPSGLQDLWLKKASYLGFDSVEKKKAAFFEEGGIYAEFGQVITIALGYIESPMGVPPRLHVRGLVADNERSLLKMFVEVLARFSGDVHFCGHNIKEFDLPYLSRRMIVQGVRLPELLNTSGKKPWEIHHIDTMELWKFGDRKSYTSLNLLTHILGIPSSKESIDGSQVNTYFYKKKDLASIQNYCMEDVVATAQVYRRIRQLPLLDVAHVIMKK